MRKMKVFFDASAICWGRSGIPIYVKQTLACLSRNQEVELHCGLKSASLRTHADYQHLLSKQLGIEVKYHRIFLPGRLDLPTRLLRKMITFNAGKYDIMHFPAQVIPCSVPPSDFSNVILTVHDMFPFHSNNNEDAAWNDLVMRSLPVQAKKAQAIFTVSEFSKKEINKYLGTPKEKIYVVPIGTQWSEAAFVPSDILQRNTLPAQSYFLTVSTLLPHKNHIALFTAFKKYQQSPDYAGEKLVVVGKRKEHFTDICQALDSTPNVIHLQNISENDLRNLYENCKGFFLVSKLEGFGIPLLEAMSCKVPACYGKGSSMDEIGRDAAYGVEPDDIDKIAETFAIFSAGGKDVELHTEQAFAISQEYSYAKTAETYVQIYKSLLKK